MKVSVSRKSNHRRRGASAVEMAITLPLILLLFWGFWEWSRVEMIRQAAANAAYEGSRRGILPGATVADMKSVTEAKLLPYSITGATITPSLDYAANRASVQIAIPIDQNLWGSGRFLVGKSLMSEFALRIEE